MPGTRLELAMTLIDEANARDPRRESAEGTALPRELLYSRRMSARLADFAPAASEHLRLAVHGQHIERWRHPREEYAADRAGYLAWRSALAAFHAGRLAGILGQVGYTESDVERVQSLVRKRRLQSDVEAQCLEDVACLVFLEHYLATFAQDKPRPKLLDILRRTWRKMSPRAQQQALELALPEPARELLADALRA